MPGSRIGAFVRQRFVEPQLTANRGPICIQPFKSADEIGQHIATAVNEPIELVTVGRRVNTSAAAELNPVDELLECHLLFHSEGLRPLVERNHAIPRIANKPELEITFELPATDADAALF